MAAHVFHKHQHVLATEQRAAVHRACGFVRGFLEADGIHQTIQLRLGELRLGQLNAVHLVHQAAKHTALPATGGHHLARGALFNAGNTVARAHGGGVHLPVHGDGFNVEHRIHQPLVAQVAQHQQLGVRAQRHQRDQLPAVHIHRQGALCRDVHLLCLSPLVDHIHRLGEGGLRLSQAGQYERL